MPRETLDRRVHRLEHRVDMLEALPERVRAVESQILQLRGEMQDGFSALRTDMRALHAQTIQVVETLNAETNRRLDETNRRMEKSNAGTNRHMEELNSETRRQAAELNAETRSHMLVLHEEVIDRIKRLGNGRGSGELDRPARRE